MARIVPLERQVVGGVGVRELGPDLALDFAQPGVAPSGSVLGGAVSRVVAVVLLLFRQDGAPLWIQTVKGEDADLWKEVGVCGVGVGG